MIPKPSSCPRLGLTLSEAYTAATPITFKSGFKLLPPLGPNIIKATTFGTTNTLSILRAHISKRDVKVTDLKSEESETRFKEKNQYGLNWILSSTQAERLHDECTVTPAI